MSDAEEEAVCEPEASLITASPSSCLSGVLLLLSTADETSSELWGVGTVDDVSSNGEEGEWWWF